MFKSAIWDFVGKISNQIIAFIISIILARILSPKEFGLCGIILVFVSFSTVILDFGFRLAIINKQVLSEEVLSTILIINLIISLCICIILFLASGFIASFYNEPELEKMIHFVLLLFIINAASMVPTAIVQKAMLFKESSIAIMVSAVLSGIIAVWMAYSGWGVWSLIARNFFAALFTCIFNWWLCTWKPSWRFNLKAVRPMFGYSSRLFVTALMDNILLQTDILIIGKLYNSTTLGYYTRAQSLDNMTRGLTSGMMHSVFFPYFSKIQHDTEYVIALYKKCLHLVAFTILALNGVLFLNANELFVLLFTEKWLLAASYYKIFALIGFVFVINVIMNILLAGTGRSKEFLQVELLKKGLIMLAYLFGFFGSIDFFLYMLLAFNLLCMLLNMRYVYKAVKLGVRMHISILSRYLIPAVCATFITWVLFANLVSNALLHIGIMSFSYLSLYVAANYLQKNVALSILYHKALWYRIRIMQKLNTNMI